MSKTMPLILIDLEWHGRELPPKILRRQGLRGAFRCRTGFEIGHPDAETDGRRALRSLVDAFLQDRVTNADLFERAHELGRLLNGTMGCFWTPGEENYTLQCPIFALHRGAAHSLAMTLTTACSICGAGSLECEHVPGWEYDGVPCFSRVVEIASFGHIALTPDPDFTYTWHQPQTAATGQLIAEGIIRRVGDRAECTHCSECVGRPTPDELDPVSRFNRLREERLGGCDVASSIASHLDRPFD